MIFLFVIPSCCGVSQESGFVQLYNFQHNPFEPNVPKIRTPVPFRVSFQIFLPRMLLLGRQENFSFLSIFNFYFISNHHIDHEIQNLLFPHSCNGPRLQTAFRTLPSPMWRLHRPASLRTNARRPNHHRKGVQVDCGTE